MGAEDTAGGISAFGTPTVVHFGIALMSAPWPSLGRLSALLGSPGRARWSTRPSCSAGRAE